MNSPTSSMFPLSLLVLLFSCLWVASAQPRYNHEDFLQCLYSEDSTTISRVTYTPANSSYSSVLQFTLQNLDFNRTITPKPLVIVTPTNTSHIQATIKCSRRYGMEIRIRSGGHDYEGISYRSIVPLPFLILDLINLGQVDVDVETKTAWVGGGAVLGQVYYRIAEKSRTLAFTAGVCPTVGVGGHISGGGYGMLTRKYGLAADNIIDAQFVDVNGRILDRASMGEDLFWAIRGGGGNTFGVVTAWKLQLLEVPPTVTAFTVSRTLEQNLTKIVHGWQTASKKLHEDVTSVLFLHSTNSTGVTNTTTIQGVFNGLYLGRVDRLLTLMQESFPELGLRRDECTEMSWIETIPYHSTLPNLRVSNGWNRSLESILNRNLQFKPHFKVKTDYVLEPMSEAALEGIWERIFQEEVGAANIWFISYGGRMDAISESSIPFPHRAAVLYGIEHQVLWNDDSIQASRRHIRWIRSLYNYLTPYASKNPRRAYINHRDLDIGINDPRGNTSYRRASIWGMKYFTNNFDRLVRVKTAVDPTDFFRNEQSIPPLVSW